MITRWHNYYYHDNGRYDTYKEYDYDYCQRCAVRGWHNYYCCYFNLHTYKGDYCQRCLVSAVEAK